MLRRCLCLLLLVLPLWAGAREDAAPASASATQPIPFKRERPSQDADMTRVLAVMLALAAALGGTLYVLRRRLVPAVGTGAKGKLVKVIERTRVGPRTTLYVVEFGAARYLLADGDQGMRRIATEYCRHEEAHADEAV